jgi:ABC-type oligopeptide transport system substrate-binding subunit
MKRTFFFITTALVILSTFLYACAQTPAIPPTATTTPTASSTPVPTSTVTPIPTATSTPEPTPIPGVQVYPLESLGSLIPWLPSDKDNTPMSVYYGFNMMKPPFNDLLVRQAFAAAVDRELIAQKALEYKFRNAIPATSLTPPEILGRDLYNQVGIPFEPSKARELLQRAGYADPTSFPPTTLLVSVRGRAAPGAYYQMAKMIVAMWETNLGVKVTIETAEIPAYRNRFASDSPHIYQLGWGADYNDPDNFLKALFHSDSEFNFGHFDNTEFDRLVEEATRGTVPEKRLLLYIQAEQILTEEEVGLIPLYHSYVPIPYVY